MPLAGGSAAGDGSDAVGGRDAAGMGPQPVTGPAASGGQTPVVVAQPQAGPSPAADMVGTTDPHPGRPGSAPSRFALGNWRVRWRLAALIAVPLLTAAVLGALTISRGVSNWQTTGRVQHLAQLNSAVGTYIQAVEDERDYSVASTANRGAYSARLKTARRVTDAAAAKVAALADGITTGDGYQPAAVQAVNAVQVSAKTLPLVREAVADPLFPMTGIMRVYTVNVIQPANTFTGIVGNEASNTDLRHDVISLAALLQAQDAKSIQRAIMLRAVSFPQPNAVARRSCQPPAGTPAGSGGSGQLQRIRRSRRAAELHQHGDRGAGRCRRHAGNKTRRPCLPAPGRTRLTPALARTLAAANVNKDMSFTIGKVRQVADELTGNISTLADTSRNNATTGLLVTSLVTLLLLLLVALVSTIVARSLIRPLRKLRADALDVAGNRLPEMVRRLSQSEGADEGVEIEPIGVTSTDEIGEVARAFDQVHREAVRLAADEAMLRGNLNAMFINLSRRSQSLIERQLSLIDSLEQSEQDSGRLSSLFRLDHLATRMRRNSENLLVLAGHEVTRRWSQPVPLVDVLRAAISEIEQYERVVLNVQPGIVVVGQAVNDVVHLVAEIVENATTFSPEDTQVYVSGQPLSSGGVLLDITDNGVGISDQEMSHANWRLDNPPVVDVAVSRRMGLFVVGRLAARHGVRVRLRHAQAGGLTALIWLPDTVAAPEVAPPLGRLRRFEADDFGPTPSLSAPTATIPAQGSSAASQATAAARIPRFSPSASSGPSAPTVPAAPSFTPAANAGAPGSPLGPAGPAGPAGPGAGVPGAGAPAAGAASQPPKPAAEGTPAGNNWEPPATAGTWAAARPPRIIQDGPPTQALPVRNGNGNGNAAGGPRDQWDDTEPAAGGPSRIPAFGGAVQPPQGPQFPVGSQNIHGSDGPSAGSAGTATNGAAWPRRAGRRPGDRPVGRAAAAADLRLAGVRLVPAQRDDHDRPAAGPEQRGPVVGQPAVGQPGGVDVTRGRGLACGSGGRVARGGRNYPGRAAQTGSEG